MSQQSQQQSILSSETELECQRFQQDEFDILSYIYLDEFHIIKEHAPHKFSILIRPYLPKHQFEYQLSIHFQFTKTYPKTPLKYDIEPIAGLTRDNLNTVTKKIEDLIYENRGKPIVYDIVEDIRSWIVQFLVSGKAYEVQVQEVKKVVEVFERPKFAAFTPVTVESFLAWKKEFDLKHKKQPNKKEGQVKMTGKEYFLGKKDEEIEQSDEEDSDDEDFDEEEEDTGPRTYDEPQNKLFMMDAEEETAQQTQQNN